MSVTFTKLFSSITESTVWCEPSGTRIVWITMLAMADSKGRVWASIPGLANRARVSIEETEQAITTFLSPDQYSRTPEHEGRRVEPIDGGWRLLNHAKYRAIRDEESAKEAKRKYINNRRKVENVDKCRSQSNIVDQCRGNAEAYTEAEADTKDQKPSPSDLSPANAGDQKSANEKIPYQQVVDAYNSACGDLFPSVSKLTDKRRRLIKARWLANTDDTEPRRRTNSVDYWSRYFGHCRAGVQFFSRAASGESRGDHAGWRPDFDFLMRESTWLGVKEGKYQ